MEILFLCINNDYNDGNVGYRYLRLLHNLYSYFLSMQKMA